MSHTPEAFSANGKIEFGFALSLMFCSGNSGNLVLLLNLMHQRFLNKSFSAVSGQANQLPGIQSLVM